MSVIILNPTTCRSTFRTERGHHVKSYSLRIREGALGGVSGLVLVALAGPVWAQAAGAASGGGAVVAPATTATAVGEIVVTAQKRQESIQTVGMSIQAATGDKL